MTTDTRNLIVTIIAVIALFANIFGIAAFYDVRYDRILKDYDKCLTATNGNKEYCGLKR